MSSGEMLIFFTSRNPAMKGPLPSGHSGGSPTMISGEFLLEIQRRWRALSTAPANNGRLSQTLSVFCVAHAVPITRLYVLASEISTVAPSTTVVTMCGQQDDAC